MPPNEDDESLFDENQKCMYSVFDKTLLTDQDKAFVFEHEDDYDAQKFHES